MCVPENTININVFHIFICLLDCHQTNYRWASCPAGPEGGTAVLERDERCRPLPFSVVVHFWTNSILPNELD